MFFMVDGYSLAAFFGGASIIYAFHFNFVCNLVEKPIENWWSSGQMISALN